MQQLIALSRSPICSGLSLVAYSLLIAYLSLTPADDVPLASVWDKAKHLAAYGLFAVLAYWHWHNKSAAPGSTPKPMWRLALYLLLIAGFSLSMEILQQMHKRHFDWADMLANCLGLLLGAVLSAVFAGVLNRLAPEQH